MNGVAADAIGRAEGCERFSDSARTWCALVRGSERTVKYADQQEPLATLRRANDAWRWPHAGKAETCTQAAQTSLSETQTADMQRAVLARWRTGARCNGSGNMGAVASARRQGRGGTGAVARARWHMRGGTDAVARARWHCRNGIATTPSPCHEAQRSRPHATAPHATVCHRAPPLPPRPCHQAHLNDSDCRYAA